MGYVLQGTRRYAGAEATDPSGYQEYDRSTCLQMVGRAGRPQFDSEGCAVIMTDTQVRLGALPWKLPPILCMQGSARGVRMW